jgi:hypothetical protein
LLESILIGLLIIGRSGIYDWRNSLNLFWEISLFFF